MVITNSPDITNLSIQVKWDLSGTTPVVRLVNQSVGNNLNLIEWAFTTISPSNTIIHQGNIDQPDIDGAWTTYNVPGTFPRPMNQFEYSGAPYIFYVTIKDSAGNTYTTQDAPQTAVICRPAGNTGKSTNTFGLASSNVQVKCEQATVFFQDNTYHSYRGLDGTLVASTLQVMYPIDETGNIPNPFQISNYSTALVPISYSSPNYQFLQNEVYDYEVGDDTIIRIKYQLLKTFAVWCNIDLMAVECEIRKLSNAIETGNCSDVQRAQNQMNAIMPKFCLVVMGTLQPLLGIDVPKLIEEIEVIGGFECNCCTVPTGIIPTNASIIDGYSFSVNKLGGDITPSSNFSVNGSNITLNIGDVSYVVRMGLASPSSFSLSAVNFTTALASDGFTRTYYLNIDGVNFQRELLVNIGNDAQSLQYLNNLITVNANDLSILVDGGCIFENTGCDYNYTLISIPVSGTFAKLSGIQLNNSTFPLSFAFNQGNLPALQTYLNTLGLGSFLVLSLPANQILIQTLNNTNSFGNLTYNSGNNGYIALLQKDCSGYVATTIPAIIQDLIYYLCDLDDSQVKTFQDYTITYINPDNDTIETQLIPAGSSVNDLITEKLDADVETINYIMSLEKLNCGNVKALFPSSILSLQFNDIILGTKGGGVCAGINPNELFVKMLQFAIYSEDALQAFCALVNTCRTGQSCSPFSSFSILSIPHSPADDLTDILVTWSNQGDGIASYTIRYSRIDNTNLPNIFYITVAGSPYTIEDLEEGQYQIAIKPIYNDNRECPYISLDTPACEGISAFNAANGTDNETIEITYTATSPKVKLIVTYPNGGSYSEIYPNSSSISWTVPSNTYGVYSLTLSPVCNETTGWIGAPTAPVLVNIPFPANSSLTNERGATVSGILISAPALNLNINLGSLADNASQTFYVQDGFAGTFEVYYATDVDMGNGLMTTGAGNFTGVVTGNKLVFSNVTVSGGTGVAITLNAA